MEVTGESTNKNEWFVPHYNFFQQKSLLSRFLISPLTHVHQGNDHHNFPALQSSCCISLWRHSLNPVSQIIHFFKQIRKRKRNYFKCSHIWSTLSTYRTVVQGKWNRANSCKTLLWASLLQQPGTETPKWPQLPTEIPPDHCVTMGATCFPL